MVKEKLPQLTEKQMKKLESIYPRLSGLTRSLELVLAKSLVDELKDLGDVFKSVFEERWRAEEAYLDKVNEDLEEVANKKS